MEIWKAEYMLQNSSLDLLLDDELRKSSEQGHQTT